MQHLTVPAGAVDAESLAAGMAFDGSSVRGFQGIHESDMLLLPDIATARIDPFRTRRTLTMNFFVHDPLTLQPYSRDPREQFGPGQGDADRDDADQRRGASPEPGHARAAGGGPRGRSWRVRRVCGRDAHDGGSVLRKRGAVEYCGNPYASACRRWYARSDTGCGPRIAPAEGAPGGPVSSRFQTSTVRSRR
jgi:hypothetical protein